MLVGDLLLNSSIGGVYRTRYNVRGGGIYMADR